MKLPGATGLVLLYVGVVASMGVVGTADLWCIQEALHDHTVGYNTVQHAVIIKVASHPH